MKSLGKLRKLALHKSDPKEKKDHQYSAQLDVLAHASQDMQDMRSCYDSLLSAAAATANSAYEFSEALLEMGNCLLEKTASSAYGENGRVLSMLGKVQLELQKLVDSYRSHIILTITSPSESLLSELRKVEATKLIIREDNYVANQKEQFKLHEFEWICTHAEMKLQCDGKREVYEHMLAQYRDKGRLRSGKSESITSEQVKEARTEYDEVARQCIFRVESLKKGQCRSLLTQAARHHAAQLNFFRKGLKSLEGVDPQIRLVSEKQHIDYQFGGLDDGEDGEGETMNNYENNDDGELSFDYRHNKQCYDNDSTSRISMKLDQVDVPHPCSLKLEESEITPSKNQGAQPFSQRSRPSSYSAPIYPDKLDPAERSRETQPSVQKFDTHVLPMPASANISPSSTTVSGPQSSSTSLSTSSPNLRHSSPLRSAKHEKSKDSSLPLPPPSGGCLFPRLDTQSSFDLSRNKRQAFSGPIPSKPWSTKPMISTSSPIISIDVPQLNSGLLSRVPVSQPSSSPNVSRSASPTLVSSPRISELHELPRPPGSLASRPASSSIIRHSAPLVSINHEHSPTIRSPTLASSNAASPLPAPPLTVPRSFSIPSNIQKKELHVAKLLEPSQIREKVEDVTSPPLTPLSLSNMKSLSTVSEVASNSGLTRGGS